MGKISIQDMAKAVADKHGLSQQDAEAFVTALFDVVNEGLHDDKSVKVKGLGTFKVIDVRERESVNVNTGERVVIESHGKITFTPDPIMRDLVNKPFAQFETVVINDGVDLDEMSKIQTQEDETDDVQESPKDEATPEDDNVEPVQEHTVEPLLTTATDVTQIDEAESDEEPARESEEVSQEPDEIETSSNVNSEPDDAQPENHADNDGEENEPEEVKTQGASHENVGETSVPVANEETVVVRVHDKKLLSRYRWLLFSVIVFLVGAIAFIIIARKYARNRQWLAMALSILVTLVFVVMIGEELSWGQRIFGWATPEGYAKINAQGETNLHNLATQVFQNVLYFGGWLIGVGLAFWSNTLKGVLNKFKPLRFLIDWLPPLSFVLIFAAGFGFGDPVRSETGPHYGSNLFIIIATAILLIAMCIRFVKYRDNANLNRAIVIFALYMITMIFSQFVSRVWESNAGATTEWLEIFVNLALMSWALVINSRLPKSN